METAALSIILLVALAVGIYVALRLDRRRAPRTVVVTITADTSKFTAALEELQASVRRLEDKRVIPDAGWPDFPAFPFRDGPFDDYISTPTFDDPAAHGHCGIFHSHEGGDTIHEHHAVLDDTEDATP